MKNDETFKYPRLYINHPLTVKTLIPLEAGQAHYLHNVLRRKCGDFVRVFNGHEGEWLGTLQNLAKKGGDIELLEQLIEQPQDSPRLHAIFCPIKKHRLDWMIEKAVELGVTDFHPILTQNTEVRKINESRLSQQIFEAAEQCERLEIPTLHPIQKIETLLATWSKGITLLSCLERFEGAKPIQDYVRDKDIAFLIGPEGGFTADEKNFIAKQTTPVDLGTTILRCETALIKAAILLNP